MCNSIKSGHIVGVSGVSMRFRLYKEKVDNVKEYVIRRMRGRLQAEDFWALKDISFCLERGSALGVVGRNGSGKSTLMKLLAGVMKPTSGTVSVYGNVAPLIELGAGFDAELTARENIFLNGAVLGYAKKDIKAYFDEIIAFSELEDFVDVPVKNFSSGMYARLGFSIATVRCPDILIADEILSVGDFLFQQKCKERINDMLQKGTTLFLVSHNMEQIEELCEKVLWLDCGSAKMFGQAAEVCAAYSGS